MTIRSSLVNSFQPVATASFVFLALLLRAGMPTVFREGPYRLHFYSREINEPPHIHVARDDFEAKFWLDPVGLSRNYGFPVHELNDLMKLVMANREQLVEAWRKYHD